MRPALEVADVVRAHGEEFRQAHAASLSPAQKRVLRAIETCRTAALGGHLERCDECGYERNAYNSCGNRHCPKCQSMA
jgi:transposase-like zinc-binding protein